MASILEIRSLAKHYRHPWTMRRIVALDGLDLDIREGEIFGLVGPNGAGKTTTFKVVLGLLRATGGTVRLRGERLTASARTAIGFLPEQPYFYDYLTVQELLTLYAQLYGLSGASLRRRVAEVIDRVQLGHKRRAALRSLSKGTLQRVGIAQAILHAPALLILDEPMSGLDPTGRHAMHELVRSLRAAGTTVIFSSHILPDAESLCDRVGVLARGRLCDLVDLRDSAAPQLYLLTVSGVSGETMTTLVRLAGGAPMENGTGWRIRLSGSAVIGPALDTVRAAAGTVESLVPVHASLEERFLAHVGHDAKLD